MVQVFAKTLQAFQQMYPRLELYDLSRADFHMRVVPYSCLVSYRITELAYIDSARSFRLERLVFFVGKSSGKSDDLLFGEPDKRMMHAACVETRARKPIVLSIIV